MRTNEQWIKLIEYTRTRYGIETLGELMRGANLIGANLSGAYLCGAYLSSASLIGANLRYANLDGVTMNWQSHELISERLRQAAGRDAAKRMAAGYIVISTDWCWTELLQNAPALETADGESVKAWTLRTMRGWVLGDEAPPKHLEAA